MQIGFFWETGSQIEWGASGSFLRDPAAMKILLSGVRSVALSGVMLFSITYMTTPYLYTMAGGLLMAGRGLLGGNNNGAAASSSRDILPMTVNTTTESSSMRKSSNGGSNHHRGVSVSTAVIIILFLLFLRVRRPRLPYDHLASTLPFALSAAFHRHPAHHGCPQSDMTPFPFPELVEPARWERPVGHYPGWIPDHSWPSSWPKWLPEHPPPGFSRWAKQMEKNAHKHGQQDEKSECEGQAATYSAATDPSKISNLDNDIYKQLKTAFNQHSVRIEHIVLLTLESARKEIFPMKQGTDLYDMVLNTYDQKKRAAGIDRLSSMTPTAQMVTGEFATNSTGQTNTFEDWPWHAKGEGGGINIKGAMTGSSLTLKSLLSSHCGVMPLPVDLLEEAKLDIYQPCLPHILGLFDSKKIGRSKNQQRFDERQWRSVFMQSSTDSYDRQALMTRRMGFDESIAKGTLDDPDSKYYPPRSAEINYFGYAEEELEPYLKDVIFAAAENKTRLFLSHMTSTTHHPWNVPNTVHREDYFGQEKLKHKDLNAFFNTVHYVDRWVGKILKYLEEARIAEQTLVVIVGDHGQAFEEDAWMQGTYENGHISNFRVPLVFRHPRLPRIEVEANATSLSIVPTILDLLVHSNSLNAHDQRIAEWLMPEYQGQSLARPFKNSQSGRRSWNIGIINAGGSLLSLTSAGDPYRLVVPVQNSSSVYGDKVFEYRFTHTGMDPAEKLALERWSLDELVPAVNKFYGAEAARWTESAALMGRWWIDEQKRIWNYP
jgi:arylsulfatase A-like enzyme